jgi:ubiquinone/menaquinone biosynthesis C-methylase UbiE
MTQDQAQASRSFGGAADLYDRLRFLPSRDVLTWVLAGHAGQVLDLAAGTGQIARQLTEGFTGDDGAIFALEPDAQMRDILRTRVPGATVLDGAAESIPLATATIDAVLVGSAWHWFDQSQALAEIARVLRDDGVLGVLGTTPDISVDWVRDIFDPEERERLERQWGAYIDVKLPSDDFGPVEHSSVAVRQSMMADDLVESFKTHSFYRTASPQRQVAILKQVRDALSVRFPGASTIELATRTLCWRVRRRPR